VISYLPEINPLEREAAQEYIDDLSLFEYPTCVVYKKENDTMYKYIRWRNKEKVFGRTCPRQKWSRQNKSMNIQKILNNLEDVDITLTADTDVSAKVQNRLEELGYV